MRGRQLPHPSPQRGHHIGPSTVDRGWRGSKHHLICDAGGIPLAVSLTGGNRNDVTQLIHWSTPSRRSVADAAAPAGARPPELFADRGYDFDIRRRQLRARGITPRIARRGVAHGSGLGRQRWVVERGLPGCTPSSGSAPATSAEATSTSDYSSWLATSSATGS